MSKSATNNTFLAQKLHRNYNYILKFLTNKIENLILILDKYSMSRYNNHQRGDQIYTYLFSHGVITCKGSQDGLTVDFLVLI